MAKPQPKPQPNEVFDREETEIKFLPTKNLIIKWPGAQRRLKSDAHAKTIAANFDPDKFGVIIVTLPDERGYYHVIDGFNRVQAVTILWGEDQEVPCRIVPVKDPIRAAQIFLGLNRGRKEVSPIDNFRVGVQAGDPDKVTINKIVRGLGYRIDSNRTEGTISAVAALCTIYNRYGGDNLKNTLELVQATWGLDVNAPIGPILLGYAAFLAEFGNKANWGRFKDQIQKNFTPGKLLGAARTLREAERNGLNDAMVRVLVNTYNRGLKTGSLGRYKS